MSDSSIVSIGFLTRQDLDRLGETFTNHIPVPQDDAFADLLAQLDRIEFEPHDSSLVLRPVPKG